MKRVCRLNVTEKMLWENECLFLYNSCNNLVIIAKKIHSLFVIISIDLYTLQMVLYICIGIPVH